MRLWWIPANRETRNSLIGPCRADQNLDFHASTLVLVLLASIGSIRPTPFL